MFFDNIFGTSGNNNSNNNRSSNDNENENDNMYSLKNISLSQGRAFLKDEKKLNRMNTYLAQNAGNNNIVGMSIEGFTTGLDMSQQPQAAVASAAASSAPEAVLPTDEATTPLD